MTAVKQGGSGNSKRKDRFIEETKTPPATNSATETIAEKKPIPFMREKGENKHSGRGTYLS